MVAGYQGQGITVVDHVAHENRRPRDPGNPTHPAVADFLKVSEYFRYLQCFQFDLL